MFNPMMFIQSIINKGNPQEMVMSMLQQNAQNNPMAKNILSMLQNGGNPTQSIENFARNQFKQQGRDFDTEFAQFKQMLGLK